MATDPDSAPDFRWQAFFRRAREPLFLLNRQRRFLFVNDAWESLTGIAAEEARGLTCLRQGAGPHDPWDVVVRAACCPPPEVLQGRPGRARRLATRGERGRQWWDIDFWPLHTDRGLLGFLGRVTLPNPEQGGAGQGTPAASPAEALAALRGPSAAWRPDDVLTLREGVLGRYGLEHLAGTMPAVRRVADQVRLASQTRAPVLLVGEPGTGKEWTARAAHALGPDRERPFVALDCARLPAAALNYQLSVVSGPWPGWLYLKEPSHLPGEVQARLLALLHGGATDDCCRVLAGCADPAADVRAGRLPAELHAALATLVIELPPLRERLDDLPALVERFLERANADAGPKVAGLTARAWEVVRAYRWPGNLRELYAVLAAARRRAKADRIDADDLPAPVRLAVGLAETPGPSERPLPLDGLLEEAERRLILLALDRARGNRTRAAELLAIPRPRLWRRMEALGLADPGAITAEPAPDDPGERRGLSPPAGPPG